MRIGVVVAVLALLAGCGAATSGTARPVAEPATARDVSTTTTAPATGAATTVTTVPPATTRLDLDAFTSPSGNITCAISSSATGTEVRCDIVEHTFDAGPAPADCPASWGSSVYADDTAAGFGCVGDPVTPDVPAVLGYGQTTQVGGVVCTSAETGVSCTGPGGQGFVLSRAAARFF